MLGYLRSRKAWIRVAKKALQRCDALEGTIMAATPHTLAEIQSDMKNGISEPLILPGSDIGEGVVRIASWVGGMLAYHFGKILDGYDAENFITMDFFDPKDGHKYNVTIQRAIGKTPAEKQMDYTKEIEQLKDLIRESAPLTWAAKGDQAAAQEWEKKATELLKQASVAELVDAADLKSAGL